MTTKADKIIYTKTDEAPMLATYSFFRSSTPSARQPVSLLNCAISHWPDAFSRYSPIT